MQRHRKAWTAAAMSLLPILAACTALRGCEEVASLVSSAPKSTRLAETAANAAKLRGIESSAQSSQIGDTSMQAHTPSAIPPSVSNNNTPLFAGDVLGDRPRTFESGRDELSLHNDLKGFTSTFDNQNPVQSTSMPRHPEKKHSEKKGEFDVSSGKALLEVAIPEILTDLSQLKLIYIGSDVEGMKHGTEVVIRQAIISTAKDVATAHSPRVTYELLSGKLKIDSDLFISKKIKLSAGEINVYKVAGTIAGVAAAGIIACRSMMNVKFKECAKAVLNKAIHQFDVSMSEK
jgi:hypothetical protein